MLGCADAERASTRKRTRFCGAQRYERSANRRDTQAGDYERKLELKAREVKLRVPKLRFQPACTQLTALPIEPSRSAIA